MKKRILFSILCISMAVAGQAQQRVRYVAQADTARVHRIEEVTVKGRRLQDIGVQQTKLDTVVLHENISASMADVLTQNSTVFIKTFGRATLSTASFRGTSASHTQVTWNGMKLNSPMLGMVDFSMIPSYFIDDATLLHGTSSVNVTGGGLGGAITLATKPAQERGFGLQYIQGIASFHTFDEYLRLTYGDNRWQSSTRVVYSSSPNEYEYRNYDMRVNEVYDDDRKLVSWEYPTMRNKNGNFNDFHILQEAYYNTGRGNRFGLTAWYMNSERGVPMLKVDYKDNDEYVNEQGEDTFRGVLSWDRVTETLKLGAKGGYTHTYLRYDYRRDIGNGTWVEMVRSRSNVDTGYGMFDAVYTPNKKWMLTGNVSVYQHFVKSVDKNIVDQAGQKAVIGYDKARIEISGYVSAKWKPTNRVGMSAALREDMYGKDFTPLIPAMFLDFMLSEKGNVMLKASASRNYRYPTLNDLYFLPGGNPNLRPERGFTYDGGAEFRMERERFMLKGEVTAFDSYINDWIMWLPTFKGFWSPVNIKKVHAYGVELKAGMDWKSTGGWRLAMDGNYSWTPSINHGDPMTWADESIGKQLVYVPLHSAAVTGRVAWRGWTFTYKWCWYSERFTTSNNETKTKIGRLHPYFMNDISLEKQVSLNWADMSFKGVINNLFNEEYETVLRRPMPRMNFQLFIEIRPKFGKK